MATNRAKMVAGEMYDLFDLELAARGGARGLCQRLKSHHVRTARSILRDLFGPGGDTVECSRRSTTTRDNIELGERVSFNFNCIVLDV